MQEQDDTEIALSHIFYPCFSNAPEKMVAARPNWYNHIHKGPVKKTSTMLSTAVNYADEHGFKSEFRKGEEPDALYSIIDFPTKTVIFIHGENIGFDPLIARVAYEAKCISQQSRVPHAFGWKNLSDDLQKTFGSKQYCLKDSYEIYDPPSAVLVSLLSDVDNTIFAECAVKQAEKIFAGQNGRVTQKDIDASHDSYFNLVTVASPDNISYLDGRINLEYTELLRTLTRAQVVGNTFGKLPEIRRIPFLKADMRRAFKDMWQMCGFQSPMETPRGMDVADMLHQKALAHPSEHQTRFMTYHTFSTGIMAQHTQEAVAEKNGATSEPARPAFTVADPVPALLN